MNNEKADYSKLFAQKYVSDVRNRVHELENPSEIDQKRWIWELIQNAKDCSKEIDLSDNRSIKRKPVDIKIIYDHKKLIFKHNGFPFTNDTLNSIMFKCSSKDENDECTGHFGTGFMSTHSLSLIVQIQAPYLSQEENKQKYVKATIYREGKNDKKLLEEFKKMESSRQFSEFDENNEEHKWTTFIYDLTKSNFGEQSANLGIESFRKNICKVLLFCNDINSIQLNDEEPIFSPSNSLKQQKSIDRKMIEIIEKSVIYNNEEKFIIISSDEINQDYSRRYAKMNDLEDLVEKQFTVRIAIQVDENNHIKKQTNEDACLFCTFPLIGSEDYQLPYIVDCPHFDTMTERNEIYLDGNERDLQNVLTNTGLNHLILNRSIDLFNIGIDWLINNGYSNFSSFSNGLINNSDKMKKFTDKICLIIMDSTIIHDSKMNTKKLSDIIFLDFDNINNPKEFHELASNFYDNIASYDECIEWKDSIWKNMPVLTIDLFLKGISNIGHNYSMNLNSCVERALKRSKELFINGLNSLKKQDFSFLNQIYSFFINEPESVNSQYFQKKIFLSANCELKSLNNLKSIADLSEDLNKIMLLCRPWENKIIHQEINTSRLKIKKMTIEDAINEINSYANSKKNYIDDLLPFVRFIIPNNEDRMHIYYVTKTFYKIDPPIYVSDVDSRIFEKIDIYFLEQLRQVILPRKDMKVNLDLEMLDTFYMLYQNICRSTNFLVPNNQLYLKEKWELKKLSNDIPRNLIDIFKSFDDFDNYIHPSITSVEIKNTNDLDYFIDKISSLGFFEHQGSLYEDRIKTIISIYPQPKNKRLFDVQFKVSKLFQFFFKQQINSIQSTINDETFWEKANEIIIKYIKGIFEKFPSINLLKNNFNKSEEETFSILNDYYSVISSNFRNLIDNTLVPNQKGNFTKAHELYIEKGISDKYFNLFNDINEESDIRSRFAHPKIECDFITVIDIEKFLNLLINGISDERFVKDDKILNAILKNLKAKDLNDKSDNANSILFEKLYIANIKPRLREIMYPNEVDKIRWIMELMQNAKDSLYASDIYKQEDVEIFIEIKYDMNNQINEVIFSHNGPPFTDNSYIGLLYKISQDKENSKSTGKFSTGFLVTLVLSKKPFISGNRIDENNRIYGFSIQMHREGVKDKEIIENFKQMQDSYKSYEKPFERTSFKYEIKSQQSIKCVKDGLIHFKKHISNVLINCPDIKCVHLIDNGIESVYRASSMFIRKISSFKHYKFNIMKNNDKYQEYIVLREYTNDSNIYINISVEIDNKLIIPRDVDTESIYVVFPLIGSKKHCLPFSINSPRFVPTTERNALILNEVESIKGEITSTDENRSILMKSIDLFGIITKVLKEENYLNIHELSYGLTLSSSPYLSFDLNWYQNTFLSKIRASLAENITLKTFDGRNVYLKNIHFPSLNNNIGNIEQFIELSSRFYNDIICKDDYFIWKDRIWETLNFVSIDDLVIRVENNSSLVNEEKMTYLNHFLSFLNEEKMMHLLYEHSLIPDMENNYHKLTKTEKNLRSSKTVPENIIEIMESIKIHWKSTHMNNLIYSITLQEDKIYDAENKIIKKVKEENQLCFDLMQFVLKDDEFRQKMFNFVVIDMKIRNYAQIYVNDINPKIWNYADNYVLHQIAEKISSFNIDTVEQSLSFLKRFIPVFIEYFKNDSITLKNAKIIPNANNKLYRIEDLCYKSDSIHDYLNQLMKQYFDKDFNDKIIHPEFNSLIKLKKTESIIDFLSIINVCISDQSKENKIKIAESFISIVPQNEDNIQSLTDQKQLFNLYHDLINPNLVEISLNEKLYTSAGWKLINGIILSTIIQKVEETKSLSNFKTVFGYNDEDEVFEILNLLYKFDDKHKTIPNKNGDFMYKKELKIDPGIKDDLLDCILVLDPKSQIHNEIVHSKVIINNLNKIDLLEFNSKLEKLFKNAPKTDEIIEMIKKINYVNCTSFIDNIASKKMTSDQEARMKILLNAHISFIKNRLRELSAPEQKDYQRWPFELIQNGIDTVRKSNKKVTLKFQFTKDSVIFTHNGSEFTNETLFALLYQCSEGKEDDKSIGRFGTGLLSTSVLSRKCHLSGDVKTTESEEKIYSFNVDIDRKGETSKELQEGVKKMENTFVKSEEIKGVTSFKYDIDLNNESSVKAYKSGLSSLRSNAPIVLILNHLIESIIIEDERETVTLTAKHENDHIQSVLIESNKKSSMQYRYLYFNSKEKFEFNDIIKDVQIDCLLPIGFNNNIIPINHDFLFLSLPIFGMNQFTSPIIINSPEFEPEKERNKLIFQFDDEVKDSYESSINKFIILEVVKLYDQMVKYALNLKCTDLFYLCCGLSSESNSFITENFTNKMREIISNIPIFETYSGMKKIDDVLIPIIDDYCDFVIYNEKKNIENKNKEMIYREFYDLFSYISYKSKHLVKYEHVHNWSRILWSDFQIQISIYNLIEYISMQDTVDYLPLIKSDSKDVFIKKVIDFVLKMNDCNCILSQNKILINKKRKFVSLNEIYCFDLTKEFFDMLSIIEYDYDQQMLHQSLNYLYKNKSIKFKQFNIKKAIRTVKDKINKNNSIKFMKYIIEEDKKKRESMYRYSNSLLNQSFDMIYIKFSQYENNESILKDLYEMFNRADKYIVDELIKKIQYYDIKKNIDFFRDFVTFLKNYFTNKFDNERIIPNQNYKLCSADSLYKDEIKDENMKNILKKLFNIDIKEQLILDDFSSIIRAETYNFMDLSNSVYNCILFGKLKRNPEKERFDFYSIFFQYSYENEELKQIIELINFFLVHKIKYTNKSLIESNCWSSTLTKKVINNIVDEIIQQISNFSNIDQICNGDKHNIYPKLIILYKYSTDGKIFPNLLGHLKYKTEVKIIYDIKIDRNELDTLFDYLIKFRESDEIKQSILDNLIEIPNDLRNEFKTIDIKFMHDDIMKNILKHKDNVELMEQFYKFINSIEYLKSTFSDLFEKQMDQITPKILANMNIIQKIINNKPILDIISKLSDNSNNESETNIQQMQQLFENLNSFDNRDLLQGLLETFETGYIGEAIVYEFLKKSNKYSLVKWMAKSDVETSKSVELNGTVYYIDEKGDHYDLYAEDFENKKYYFEVKSTKYDLKNEKLCFYFSGNQYQFATNLNSDENFYLALVINTRDDPQIMMLKKQNI